MDEKIKLEESLPELEAPTVVSEKGVLLRTSARVSKKLRMTPVSIPSGLCSKIGYYFIKFLIIL